MEPDGKELTFEDIIKSIGNDGKFQKRFHWLFNFVLVIFASMNYLNIIMAMSLPDHWCTVPGRENTNLTIEEWKEIHLPKKYDANGKFSYSKCTFYNDTYSEHSANETNIIECNQGWEFDQTWYKSTIPIQESWVCENEHYRTNTLAILKIGALLGTFIIGQMADAIGRKPVFFLTVITVIVGNFMTLCTTSIPGLFYIAALIAGSPSTSVFLGPYVIAMEISQPKDRAQISMLRNLGWTFGFSIVSLILWAIQDWIYFMILTTAPLLLFLFPNSLIIESPRWLLGKEKTSRCIKELKKIAKVNKKHLSNNISATLAKKENKIKKVYGVLGLLSSWRLAKNSVVLIIELTTVVSIYYLLTLNINYLGGNPFMNCFWQGFVEFPAFILGRYACDRFGRRITNILSFLCTFIGFVLILFLIQDESKALFILIITMYIKFTLIVAAAAAGLQTIEIFPTCIRQTGIAVGGISGNAFAIAVPYIMYLGISENACYPYVFSVVLCAISLIAAFFLPETLNQKLPETLDDAAKFGVDQDFWGKPKRKQENELEEAEKALTEKS